MPRHSSILFRRLLTGLALVLLLGSSLQASARIRPVSKKLKQQIVILEQQWRAATLSSDVALMDRLLSDDYVGISWTGQVNTKSSQLERLRKRMLVVTRMDLSDVKIKLLGPAAIVTSRVVLDGSSDGTPMTGEFRYTRVYQRLPGGLWKITNFEATRLPVEARTRDAQPL